MSFSVSTGFRIINTGNFIEAHAVLSEIKDLVAEKKESLIIDLATTYTQDLLYTLIASKFESAEFYELATENELITSSTKQENIFMKSIWQHLTSYLNHGTRMAESNPHYNNIDEVDLFAEIVLYTHNESIFGTYHFGKDGRYSDVLLGHKNIESYDYQNYSDSHEGISDKKWEERCDVWHSIFKDKATPSDAGIVVKLTGHDVPFHYKSSVPPTRSIIKQIIDRIGTADELADKFTSRKLVEIRIDEAVKENPIGSSAIMNAITSAKQNVEVEKNNQSSLWKKQREAFINILPSFSKKRRLVEICSTL